MVAVNSIDTLISTNSRAYGRSSRSKGNGKDKVHPVTGHEDPEMELRYSSTLSLISELCWGEWSTPRLGRFTPGNDPVPIV